MTDPKYVMPEVTINEDGIPVIKNIHQEVLRAIEHENHELNMSDWHGKGYSSDAIYAVENPLTKKGKLRKVVACMTTHCRAGWVVHLAGKAGYKLQNSKKNTDAFSITAKAARDIYRASGFSAAENINFYSSNSVALKDIKRMAEEEKELGHSDVNWF